MRRVVAVFEPRRRDGTWSGAGTWDWEEVTVSVLVACRRRVWRTCVCPQVRPRQQTVRPRQSSRRCCAQRLTRGFCEALWITGPLGVQRQRRCALQLMPQLRVSPRFECIPPTRERPKRATMQCASLAHHNEAVANPRGRRFRSRRQGGGGCRLLHN